MGLTCRGLSIENINRLVFFSWELGGHSKRREGRRMVRYNVRDHEHDMSDDAVSAPG